MAAKTDIYETITNKIIDALENGIVPWQKPWTSIGGPRNLQSKRPYRGINAFLLGMAPFTSPFWTTFKGASANNAVVKKGEKGTLVVFWRILKVADSSTKSGEKNIPLLRYYTVFNVDQLEALDKTQPIKLPKTEDLTEFDAVDEAERVMDDFLTRDGKLTLQHGGDSAFYRPSEDLVQLPAKKQFADAEGYYATAFHEFAHATGHADRTGRVKDWSMFGTNPYAKEELVAEMAAAMVSGYIGMEMRTEASAAYISSWLKALKDDTKLIISAGSQAQKAADFILGNYQPVDSDESAEKKELVAA